MSLIKRYPSTSALPLSRASSVGGFLFLSGQIPVDATGQIVRGDIRAQTCAVLDRITETLALSGATRQDILRVTVWLSDLALFDQFNAAYRDYFPDNFPSRSTVQAKLVRDVDIEIEVQAWVDTSNQGYVPGPTSEA